jgi:uncharacterized ferritin-like protein (DUF455 family)
MDLHAAALGCLECSSADAKIALTRDVVHSWKTSALTLPKSGDRMIVADIVKPGMPENILLVDPFQVPKRKPSTEAGRRAFVHAIAHIEFNAVNLAWECVWRFRGLPTGFYDDWVSVAGEEAEHFAMLRERLVELGSEYGDFPAHNGLWEMAEKTADDLIARMAMVPRYLEARGLDVTPGMIERMERLSDRRTADILRFIYEQEIRHVEIGSRWFRWACAQEGIDPDVHFDSLLERFLQGRIRGPINVDARRSAGFSETELARLTRDFC